MVPLERHHPVAVVVGKVTTGVIRLPSLMATIMTILNKMEVLNQTMSKMIPCKGSGPRS